MNEDDIAAYSNGDRLAQDFFLLAYTQDWHYLESEDDMLRQAISSLSDVEVATLQNYLAERLRMLNDTQLDHLLFDHFQCESTRRGIAYGSPDRKPRAHLEYIVQFLTKELSETRPSSRQS